MTETPKLLDHDVLSDALDLLEPAAGVFFRGSFKRPWAVRIPPVTHLPRELGLESQRVVLFHAALRGSLELRIEGGSDIQLSSGDLVLLHDIPAHIISEGRAHALPMQDMLGPGRPQLPIVVETGDADSTRLVCGGFFFHNTTLDPLLASLPSVTHVRSNQGFDTLSGLLAVLARETSVGGPGSRTVLERLSDLLLVEVLRRVVGEVGGRGWFAALGDPVLSRALAALHGAPAHAWTIAELARYSGVSRSGLAARFREVLDDSPGLYLTRLRMRLACRLLRKGDKTVAEVAAAVGYQAVEAFSRAFKRHVGRAPSLNRPGRNHHSNKPTQ